MKKSWIAVFALLAVFALSGCSGKTPAGSGLETGGGNSEIEMGGENSGSETPGQGEEVREIAEMYLTIGENKLKVALAKNEATAALITRLNEGDIVYYADDYGDFEKVGGLGFSLPRSDTQIVTAAGDVVLYQGNQLVLFYGNNSWSYTRIGKIEGYSVSELRTLLGAGQGRVKVTVSLK